MPIYWVLDRKLALATVPADENEIEEWVKEGVKAVLSMLNEADLPATWSD